jgi:oxygen-dependent protoporphyrinogen oxidase
LADFIVIGGGVGGLVAARRLVLGGHHVVLLEKTDRLGGSVAHHSVGGIELDAGAESFATRGGTVEALARSLGLGDAVVFPNPEGAWLQPATGPAFRLPENSLLGIPGSPLASDVMAIIGKRAALRAFADALLPASVGAQSKTLGEVVRKRMGSAVVDQLVRPITRGVHSADADELEFDRVAPGLRAAMRRTGSLSRAVLDTRVTTARAGSAVAGIRGGVHRLVEELEADLERFGVDVRLGVTASAVETDSVMVDGRRLAGRVVAAAPGLIGPTTGPGHRVILATLVVDQPELDSAPRGTGVLVAEGATGISARALTHATAKWAWLADRAAGQHVIRLSYENDSVDLAERARHDAEVILSVPLSASRVSDFARVAWYRPERQSHTPHGILAVGETIAGTGLASIVAQAEAVAASVAADSET